MAENNLNKLVSTLSLLLTALVFTSPVMAETVRVPIQLDYPVLRQLMLSQLFNGSDNSADKKVEILHDAAGCSTVFLSNPRLHEYQKKLEIITHVKANIATVAFGNCTPLFNWEGDARFLTDPIIKPGARSIGLKILRSQFYNPQGQLITGQIWELASGRLLSFMNRYEIDLAPTINQLNKLLPDILDKRSALQISKISDSLKLGAISIESDGIDVAVALQIDRLPATQEPVATLSFEEIQKLEANWQMMDAMITFAVKRYANATNQQELRDTLAEIFLDARYRLVDALTMPVSATNDPVRHWFIDSWQKLGPILRQISLENPGQEPMLISLLAATDALAVLDRLGPSIGLDISVNGLRRLGRMLIDQPGTNPLFYDNAVDPELRHLFRLSPFMKLNAPSGFNFSFWPISSAWATSSNERLALWVPTKSELPEYLPIVRDLLEDSAGDTIEPGLNAATKKLFQNLVLTTAWQESCWRQYVLKNREIVTLHSSTGDTGLMQINERVWRGLYNTQKLRWDIAYNARAGTEILLNYLLKYSLKRGEHKLRGGLDNLARSAYSAYNGGPSKTSRYRDPQAILPHQKIDAAFWTKYQAVKQGNELQVVQCLGGKALPTHQQSAKNVPIKPDKQPSAVSRNDLGKTWILAQDKHHYTLQLAVFSSLKAAQKFTEDTQFKGSVAIAPLGKEKEGQFVVIKGSFKEKAAAQALKQQYKNIKPWLRQIKDIHSSIKR
ncbi:lytic transglycosylase domain-containing protein [Psychromonas sp. MB-3u-54]|uniref:lytic transglycosylase domain-containing protein n=1 Tax=Psychromonas sp. MB-3u-54 TaxID=2058319 RepID=UPI0018E30053|nr:lytic transglycosylase domain-containing protein [Psychromonas sp. MB-3u-54]